MAINISDNSPRVSYTVAQGQTQTSFAVTFIFFDDADLNVYVDGVLKTLASDYTVTGGDGATGTVTISVTGASGGSSVVVTRSIALERTSDFPTSGPFQVDALNTELDRLTGIVADLEDKADRGLQLTDYDLSVNLVLPDLDGRKGRTLAFNEVSGAVEAGPTISDVQTVSAAAADIATLADIEDGTDATDAIQTVAGISGNVTTVAGVSTNVTTVAGNNANVTTVATNIADVNTTATNIADVNTAASNITEIQNASTNAATATTKAAEAATSASNASTSETNAASSAASSAASAANAATSETNAATSASNAATSETNAATSATAAAASQTAAANSAAAAAAAFDNFDDTYLGSKTSDPTVDNDGDPLTSGDLYFNSTANEMRVYDGANWIAATSAGNVSLLNYNYTATSGQTTFSGADDNAATLSYTQQNIIVTLNGIVLEDGTDYTANNGTSIVLASGAAAGDELNIVAFKSFTTADMVPASTGGTFSGDVTFAGAFTSQGIDDNATSTAMTLDSNGNLLVGTTSATAGRTASSAANNQVAFMAAGDVSDPYYPAFGFDGQIGSNGGRGAGMYLPSDGTLAWSTAGTERMRIDSSGNLLVGTTDPSLYDNTSGNGISLQGVGELQIASNNNCIALNRTNSTDGDVQKFFKQGSQVGSITVTGSSTAYNTSSDYRLKEDVQPMVGAFDRVLALNPVNFAWKASGERVDGFLAHEAQAVVPEAVTGAKDAMRTQDVYDEDGNVTGTEEVPDYQGIDQSKLVPLLTAALQEAITKIETLETKVAALESNT